MKTAGLRDVRMFEHDFHHHVVFQILQRIAKLLVYGAPERMLSDNVATLSVREFDDVDLRVRHPFFRSERKEQKSYVLRLHVLVRPINDAHASAQFDEIHRTRSLIQGAAYLFQVTFNER